MGVFEKEKFNKMRGFLFLPLIQAEIICKYDEPCLKACTDTVCEYFWNVEHRFTRTWRTQDFGEGRSYTKGALRDFPIEWNSTKGNFDIIQDGINRGVEEVFHENGNVKNPLEELENLFLVDGQPERKVITINGQLPGPKIIVNKGALVKITVKSTLHEESCKSPTILFTIIIKTQLQFTGMAFTKWTTTGTTAPR